MKSQFARATKRRPGRRAFVRDFYGKHPTGGGRGNEARKAVLDFGLWLFDTLSRGESAALQGVGAWTMTFRKGRSSVGKFKTFQPPQYVLKFKPSANLKVALKQLAVQYPDPATLPMNACKKPGKNRHFATINAKPAEAAP